MAVPVPVFMVAGLVNILAKNYNFNINMTQDPDFDIRVKREVYNDVKTPLIPQEFGENDGGTKLGIETPREQISYNYFSKSKRDTYQQPTFTTTSPYNYNGNPYGSNGNINTNNNVNVRWKSKKNFFSRAYDAVADSLGYKSSTPIPYRYSHNIGAYGNNPSAFQAVNPVNDPLYASYNRNGSTNGNNGNINNDKKKRKRIKSDEQNVTEKRVDSACLFCFTTTCADNQTKVGDKCVDINSDKDYIYE